MRTTKPSSFRPLPCLAVLAVLLIGWGACDGDSPPSAGWQQPVTSSTWSHRSNLGGGDVHTGSDGRTFYYLDRSGSSYTQGN